MKIEKVRKAHDKIEEKFVKVELGRQTFSDAIANYYEAMSVEKLPTDRAFEKAEKGILKAQKQFREAAAKLNSTIDKLLG